MQARSMSNKQLIQKIKKSTHGMHHLFAEELREIEIRLGVKERYKEKQENVQYIAMNNGSVIKNTMGTQTGRVPSHSSDNIMERIDANRRSFHNHLINTKSTENL